MYDMYWFLDSVPTEDLGLTKDTIVNGEDYYVIGGIGGELSNIIEVHDKLNLAKYSGGRKFVRNSQNWYLANTVLNELIGENKIFVFGTVFYHSKIPEVIKKKFVSFDNQEEKGIIGMQGRAFAQIIWIFMNHILQRNIQVNPIVCLDYEDRKILQSVEFHIKAQLAGKLGEVKVQSRDKARKDERKGHKVSDTICSLFGNYVKFPHKRMVIKDLIAKTIKFDTRVDIQFDKTKAQAQVVFRTDPVIQWTL